MKNETHYAIYGKTTPPMLGRARVFDRIQRNQTKPNPDPLSIIAPPHMGKTVLMTHIAEHFRRTGSPYLAVVHWDMRHETPTSDQDFLNRFALHFKTVLDQVYAEQVVEGEHAYAALKFVVDALSADGKSVLVLLDGFDYALANEGLSRGLFNNVRKLAETSSLCFITASTAPLRELCSSDDTASSDFWELFGNGIVQLKPLDDDDWNGLLAPLTARHLTLEKAARSELLNWCGGHPLLAVMLLGAIDRKFPDNTVVTKEVLDELAESLVVDPAFNDPILRIWESCDLELREALGLIPCGGAVTHLPAAEILGKLIDRGLIWMADNRYRSARFMERIAGSRKPTLDRMRELFGEATNYQKNMRLALEIRLGALSGVDLRLRDAVSKAIREVDSTPEDVLRWARQIAQLALQLVWKSELGGKREFPPEWLSEWRHAGIANIQDKLPSELGRQCAVLRLIVGDARVGRVAKSVSKQSALLINFLQAVGDYGQHQDGDVIGSFGTSVCHSAVELCETLSADLK